MLLIIDHRTELSYTAPVSETVMELRMTPRSDARQTLRGFRTEVGPPASLTEYVDWIANRVQVFSILPLHDRVVIAAQSAVETHPVPVSLASVDDQMPVSFEGHRYLDFMQPSALVVEDPRLRTISRTLGLDDLDRVGPVLDRVTQGLLDHLQYEKGVTTSATTLSHALDAGAGVCQDFAHIAIGLLRHRGIPARYVSGYLHQTQGAAEIETHAWCEAYTQSHGWVPLDPTHRMVPEHEHVAVATGRDFADVPPNRGVYRGAADETIHVRVTIEPVASLPEGLLAPRATQADMPSLVDIQPPHHELLDYQQEQQQQ
jgi:transglutaminase-like putative cysteine protease